MNARIAVQIREILLATDFSPDSDRAFRGALALAQHFSARLHLFHVVKRPRERESALAGLKALALKEMDRGDFEIAIAVGNPAHEIVRYAERKKMDLIVMGTHGRTGFAHVLLGSVAEAVVRTASCQVLTIKRQGETRGAIPQPADAGAPVAAPPRHCLVCIQPSEDLICDPCKARIRGEALERKYREEKAGRKGLSI